MKNGSSMSNASEIGQLLEECRAAASQDSLTSALSKLAAAIPTTREGRRDEIALFLIRNVVILGSGTISALDQCLDACGIESTLGACSQIFLEAASIKIESPCPLETSLRTVKRLLLTLPTAESSNDGEQSSSCVDSNETTAVATNSTRRNEIMKKACMENIVSIALLIPSRISNACHFQKLVLPAWSVRSRYIPRLVECALATTTSTCDLYLRSLVPRIVRNGASDEVAIALYQYYHKFHPDEDWFQNTILTTLQCISTPRDCATLLRSIVRHILAQKECPETESVENFCQETLVPYLNMTCRPILESSREIRQAFVQLSILSSTSCSSRGDAKSDRIFCHSVALLLASCETNNEESSDERSDEEDDFILSQPTSVLEHHLIDVTSCWSETVFVQRTNGALQHHVTRFILSAIPMLEKENRNPLSSLVTVTLNGVSIRLQSSIHDIRRDGMRVGEALAEYMDQPLKFDEMDNERETTREEVSSPDKDVKTVDTPPNKIPNKRRRRKRAPRQVDPDADYISDDDSSVSSDNADSADDNSDDDSVWDDTDELIPYNLEDDEEDLRETPTPLYLRECLDMLRTPDTNDLASSHHESGLEAVSSLVRSDPVDLPDLTLPLCLALLSMENKFDLPKFEENLASGLLSLMVMQPLLAGEYVINEFFGGDRGLSTRLLMLHTLEEVAYELCGDKALKEGREKRKSERTSPTQETTGKRRLVPDPSGSAELRDSADRALASVESRTRRWGSGNRQTKPLTVVNKFGPVAAPWFYAMIAGFMKHKDDTILWGGSNGARLLASFLIALATIVQCSGLAPGTDILARDLCEFAWSFRTVDVPEVRTAVLIAIANSLAVLREDALMNVLYSLNDLPVFLRGVALDDSDERCRTIAATISSNVSQLLGNMVDSRSIAPG